MKTEGLVKKYVKKAFAEFPIDCERYELAIELERCFASWDEHPNAQQPLPITDERVHSFICNLYMAFRNEVLKQYPDQQLVVTPRHADPIPENWDGYPHDVITYSEPFWFDDAYLDFLDGLIIGIRRKDTLH